MERSLTTARPAPARTPLDSGARRADIDGLRALAIVLVVTYHVWWGRVSGGVDVFLMISSFLLTASFVRRIGRSPTGVPSPALGAFWLRRFQRLLPSAALTILAVLAAALVLFPATEWTRTWRDAWSSLLYFENWNLAFTEVDYYARDGVTPSPFQHFWSLSMQGQVFVMWPLIIAGVWWVLRRRRRLVVPALGIVFGSIFVFSLWFSIVSTEANQSFAYFDTRARLWEFAAGSLVALALPYLHVPRPLRAALGWIGVAGIVSCGIVLDVQGGFPGYLALWPIVCTALVIVAGTAPAKGGPGALLASSPLRFIGRDAYALYLVHWPVLIIWMVVSGRSDPGWLAGTGIIVLSFSLARALTHLVERPLATFADVARPSRRAAAVIAVSALIVVAPLAAWQGVVHQRTLALQASDSHGYPGAAQVDTPIDLAGVDLPVLPAATALDDEWVSAGVECEGALRPSDAVLEGSCLQNEFAADATTPTFLVAGDSHAQQLMAPLLVLADENNWGVISLLKGGCPLGVGAPAWSASGPPCDQWRAAALSYALDVQPDAVYLVATRATPTGPEVMIEGIDEVVGILTGAGIEVAAVRDTPRFDFDMYLCVVSEEECAVPEVAADIDLDRMAADPRVFAVDFRRWLCPEGMCEGEIGNLAVYIDDNHLSASYGRTLAPMLAEMLAEADSTRGLG